MFSMKLNRRRVELELAHLGWSKYRLANEMKVKRQWIYMILQRDSCTLRTVNKIAEALRMDPKDLLI